MTRRYEDLLAEAIDAVRSGEALESVLARMPDHAGPLRQDLSLAQAVRAQAQTLPAPGEEGRRRANTQLMAQLQRARNGGTSKSRWGPWFSFSMPRFAFAAALIAVTLVGAGLFLSGGGSSVEAATIEGVVLDNSGDTLVVQTLDSLEQVRVPTNVPIADPAGAPIALKGIDVGQVVSIKAQRVKGAVVASRVQKLVDGIEAWCSNDSQICQSLADRLDAAEQQCQAQPRSCPAVQQRISELRTKARDAVRLGELRKRCQGGGGVACQELAAFCAAHTEICSGIALPSTAPRAGEGLRQRIQACRQGDASVCAQLRQSCQNNANLCPADLPSGAKPAQ